MEAPSGEAGRCVGEPSFMTYRQRITSVEDGTLLHNPPQQSRGVATSPAHRGGALAGPIRRSRFGGIGGAKHRAAGISWGLSSGGKQKRSAHRREGVRD